MIEKSKMRDLFFGLIVVKESSCWTRLSPVCYQENEDNTSFLNSLAFMDEESVPAVRSCLIKD